jgi:hypothetical protein
MRRGLRTAGEGMSASRSSPGHGMPALVDRPTRRPTTLQALQNDLGQAAWVPWTRAADG